MTSARTQLLRIVEALDLVALVIDPRLATIAEHCHGQPQAARADRTGSASAWCWTHEREVAACRRLDLDCTGEVVGRTDPTGEAAVANDRARSDMRRVLEDVGKLGRIVDGIVDVLAGYDTERRSPNAADLATIAASNRRVEPGCALCAKVTAPGYPTGDRTAPAWWNEVHRVTDMGGLLAEPTPLCHAHIRRIRATGAVTSKADTTAFRDAGKWPGVRA